MQESRIPITKLTNGIYRITLAHTSEVFKKYSLGAGTYPFLLTLYNNEGISQNQVSKMLSVDKALSARVIKNLVNLGYVRKEANREDSRACRLYLTDKAKAIIPEMKEELNKWNDIMGQSLSEEEKDILVNLLDKILTNAKHYRTDKEKCN